MAVPSVLRQRKQGGLYKRQRWTQFVELARDVGIPSLGTWVDTEGIYPFTVTLEGDFQGVARLLVSNRPEGDPPADDDIAFPQIGPDLLAADTIVVAAPYQWMKLYVVSVDNGTIKRVMFLGVEAPV